MDFHLIQALHETRNLADDHADEPGWQELRARVDTVLDRITTDAADPTTEAIGVQRIDRAHIPEDAELAIAALQAVHDRPEPEQLELATAAVDELDAALTDA